MLQRRLGNPLWVLAYNDYPRRHGVDGWSYAAKARHLRYEGRRCQIRTHGVRKKTPQPVGRPHT
jgi:hypothetical protein